MTFDDFVQTLVAECVADGNTLWAEQLLADARSKVTSNRGQMAMLTDSTVNGKTFSRRPEFTALQVMNACRQAINIYNEEGDEVVPVTRADFSSIIR